MVSTLEVQEGGGRICWAAIDLQGVWGLGRINPRLRLRFTARPVPNSKVVLGDVTLRLEYHQELIGEGRAVNVDLSYDPAQVYFEVVTSQRLLRHVTDGLAPTAVEVQLDAQLSGIGRSCMSPNAPSPQGQVGMVNDPPPGEWKEFSVSSGRTSSLLVNRGEWYTQLLAPTRNEQYRYLEVALPRDDKALGVEWANAVGHLASAERFYASGDDPAVFEHLRGALDALPGATQQILDDITDQAKRADLDDLLKQAGKFLHNGRHVARDGTGAGTFPVDHLDAAFALDLMRVLLSHLSLRLSAERERARG